MKKRNRTINFYYTTINVAKEIDDTSDTGSFYINDKTKDWYTLKDWEYYFHVVVDLYDSTVREIFRIWKVVWTELFYDKRLSVNGWKKEHLKDSIVQLNNDSETLNYLSANSDDFWYIDNLTSEFYSLPLTGLVVVVKWWIVNINLTDYTILDTTITVPDNTSWYIYLDYATHTIKASASITWIDCYSLYSFTSFGGNITALVDVRAVVVPDRIVKNNWLWVEFLSDDWTYKPLTWPITWWISCLVNGSTVGSQAIYNFIPGIWITISWNNDAVNNKIDLTFSWIGTVSIVAPSWWNYTTVKDALADWKTNIIVKAWTYTDTDWEMNWISANIVCEEWAIFNVSVTDSNKSFIHWTAWYDNYIKIQWGKFIFNINITSWFFIFNNIIKSFWDESTKMMFEWCSIYMIKTWGSSFNCKLNWALDFLYWRISYNICKIYCQRWLSVTWGHSFYSSAWNDTPVVYQNCDIVNTATDTSAPSNSFFWIKDYLHYCTIKTNRAVSGINAGSINLYYATWCYILWYRQLTINWWIFHWNDVYLGVSVANDTDYDLGWPAYRVEISWLAYVTSNIFDVNSFIWQVFKFGITWSSESIESWAIIWNKFYWWEKFLICQSSLRVTNNSFVWCLAQTATNVSFSLTDPWIIFTDNFLSMHWTIWTWYAPTTVLSLSSWANRSIVRHNKIISWWTSAPTISDASTWSLADAAHNILASVN